VLVCVTSAGETLVWVAGCGTVLGAAQPAMMINPASAVDAMEAKTFIFE
jgi:hypothetical protein